MKRLAIAIAAIALIATPAFAADMAVKAPPAAPAPVPSWTGFYGGIQFGGAWSDEAVNYSPNDAPAAEVLSGINQIPVANGYRIPQSGPVGGFEAGYNWQAGSNWLVGLEADFSWAGVSGTASGTTLFAGPPSPTTQTTTAQQSTDWYGTVRGRAGWLATPNLLLFGTGGFAYGRVDGSANYRFDPAGFQFIINLSGVGVSCFSGAPCFAGSSSEIRTGWTAGGGAEWLLDQHWSAKVEYQFVDLGSETVRITGTPCLLSCHPTPATSSFNAVFQDRFNVVRLGLNYRY
jgi:outer membrane immunogenic protein